MNLLWRPWRLYADFAGRSRRAEFFLFFVTYYCAIFVAALIGVMAEALIYDESPPESLGFPGWAAIIVMLAGIIPAFAVIIRRLHDQDKPGWFLIITFVPVIGGLFWLLIAFWPGTKGENDYGWDPREDAPEPTNRLEQIFS